MPLKIRCKNIFLKEWFYFEHCKYQQSFSNYVVYLLVLLSSKLLVIEFIPSAECACKSKNSIFDEAAKKSIQQIQLQQHTILANDTITYLQCHNFSETFRNWLWIFWKLCFICSKQRSYRKQMIGQSVNIIYWIYVFFNVFFP